MISVKFLLCLSVYAALLSSVGKQKLKTVNLSTEVSCTRVIGQTENKPEAKSLGEIQTKDLRVAIHSHLSVSSFALRFLFLQTRATSLLYIGIGERRKIERKPHPLPYGLRNPYRNLKSENSQDYAQEPQRNCVNKFGF